MALLSAKRNVALALGLLVLVGSGCGGSTSDLSSGEGSLEEIAAFKGVKSVSKVGTSWLLEWDGINGNVLYGIYLAPKGEAFDFTQAQLSIADTSYKYKPANIFENVTMCFVVRIITSTLDQNENAVCTDEQEQYTFPGATELTRNPSTGVYTLHWDAIPVEGIAYTIYERQVYEDSEAEFDFETATETGIADNVYEFPTINQRGVMDCYVVRYYHPDPDFPIDENINEVCTELEPKMTFSGIAQAKVLSATSVQITWTPSESEDVVGYRILQGYDYKERVLPTDLPPTESTVTLEDLQQKEYAFAVRAVDKFGRTDNNIGLISVNPE